MGRRQKIGVIIFVLLCIVITGSVVALTPHHQEHTQTGANKKNVHVSIRAALPKKPVATQPSRNASANNPLANRKFYIDNSRSIARLARQYRLEGKIENVVLIDKIAAQPGSTWLTGPSTNDPTATRDINEVKRTSAEAAAQGSVPVYELYAIPHRDVCAGYSQGGFKTDVAYLQWLDQILASLKSDAIFTVEPDAVAHIVGNKCMSPEQANDRQQLLRTIMSRLRNDRRVLAAYLDAGHSEWFPDPNVLIGPLRKSGIDLAQGITVNSSFFVATPEITTWAQKLVVLLGADKGVLIDTSRNGKGVPAPTVTGEARWCNPSGRGIGAVPSTNVNADHIDAYFWGKVIGESDGSCFGNPAASVFVPQAALELARNSAN